jgi:Predicted metal-dependent hydrolase of the TIM-barrel fold
MIIDSNVLFGFENQYEIDLCIEKSLNLMQEKGIQKSVITNLKCKYYDFDEGNRETYAYIQKYPDQLMGYVSFHQSQFLGVEKAIEKGVFEYGLFGVRIFNTSSGFISEWGGGLDSLFLERIFSKLEKWGIPVFIEGGYPFQLIKAIADKHPELDIIASGTGYGNMGEAICAAQECQNIYLEISTLDTMDGIGMLVKALGDDQIVFGTGMPYNCPSPELFMVKNAEIPQESKDKIFSGNLLKLAEKRRTK